VTVLEDLAPPPKVEVWLAAIAALEGLPYATILPGHGQPGDRGPYGDARAYLTAARAAAEADGLNRYLVTAFPATAAPLCSTCRTTFLTRAIADAWPRAARLTRRDRYEPQRMGAAGLGLY
jgi:hypothetical protein